MTNNTLNNVPKIPKIKSKKITLKYFCEKCDYSTLNKKDYNKHLDTQKHVNNYQNKTKYKCSCGKSYKHASSLWKHKNKCSNKIETPPNPNNIEQTNLQELVLKVLTDNQQILQTITDIIPQIGNNNNNNNNNTFNIQIFLNEKCKDAISMDEFVEKVQISMNNLLTTKDKGLGEGLSNIIIDNMNKLSLYERPIHCTDKKRETLYVKNKEWKKDIDKTNINILLQHVIQKQLQNVDKWTNVNPNYVGNDRLCKEYLNLLRGCMGSIDKYREKVLRKICNNVYLNKEGI